MKRIPVYRDGEMTMIKPQDEKRFLERGWLPAQPPTPKKVSNKAKVEVKVEAEADVIPKEDESIDPYMWEAPLISIPKEKPTNNQ